MLRKTFSFMIIFVMLLGVFQLTETYVVRGENTLYVGGTGEGNFSKIQDAINASSDNDTVLVYDGTYYENLIVNKSINLIGSDNTSTIINGTYGLYVVQIKSSYVNISNFNIKHGRVGILILGPEYSSNNIGNNWFFENWEGIRLENSSGNTINYNIFQNNSNQGIISYESTYNEISENIFIENTKAIFLARWSDQNIIYNNNISNNKNGIHLDYSSYNSIYGNIISMSSNGIYIVYSNYNNITDNNIHNNSVSGIYLSESEGNIVEPNTFFDNKEDVKEDLGLPHINTPGFEIILVICAILIVFILNRKKSR